MLSVVCLFALGAKVATGASWHAGVQKSTVLGVAVGASTQDVWGAVPFSPSGSGVYYNPNGGNVGDQFFSGGALNMDIAVSGDGTTVCTVGPGSPGGAFCGPANSSATLSSVTTGINVVSQDIESFGTSSFAVIGHFSHVGGGCPGSESVKTEPMAFGRNPHPRACSQNQVVNGGAISKDNGVTWKAFDLGLNQGQFTYEVAARYGAFPSDNTFYVTWGTWPSFNDTKVTNGIHARISPRLAVLFDDEANQPLVSFISARHLRGGYAGGISKSTDGGKTWTVVYDAHGQFCFNQISCFDENNCFAVGENGKQAGIVATTDGGANWHLKKLLSGPYSLHAVKMLSNSEIWVSGGTVSSGPYDDKEWVGQYYHSTDGGATWDLTSFNGYGFDLSFKNGVGYAAALFKKHTDLWVFN